MDPSFPGDWDIRKQNIFLAPARAWLRAVLANIFFWKFIFLTLRSVCLRWVGLGTVLANLGFSCKKNFWLRAVFVCVESLISQIYPWKWIFHQNHFSLFIRCCRNIRKLVFSLCLKQRCGSINTVHWFWIRILNVGPIWIRTLWFSYPLTFEKCNK